MPVRKGLSLAAATLLALFVLVSLLALARATSQAAPAAIAPDEVVAVQYATGLNEPVDIAVTGLATDTRLFVVQRAGQIKVITTTNGLTGTVLGTSFLDIDSIVNSHSGGEMGLLGLAFSPNYGSDGRFYVYYNNNAGDINVARYTVSANPNVANITATIILTIPHPGQNNHNGGDLAFGPDGYLYLAPGDGGGGGDPNNNAQNLNSLLGKVLRLNVTDQVTYSIPASNPYTQTAGRDEIWAMGLRNPFRFSFDRLTGDLYIGDVGQGAWEEIDHQPAGVGGQNYGWRCYEGNHTFNPDGCGSPSSYTAPVAEYCNSNSGGCSNGGRAVIGGHVYRGLTYPDLYGYYFFADSLSSRFWAMLAQSPWTVTLLNISNVPNPGGFGENASGQIFVTSLGNGRIYCLVGPSLATPTGPAPTPDNPIYFPAVYAPAGSGSC